MRLSYDQNAARSVGRNSERFRHRTTHTTAFGGTALRSAVRATLRWVTLSCIAMIAGCASNPTEFLGEIKSSRSITIVCCDTVAPAAFRSVSAMLASSILGRGLITEIATRDLVNSAQDARSAEFYKNAGEPPLPLPALFVDELAMELRSLGYSALIAFPRSFDGSRGSFVLEPAEVQSALVLEIRYAGHIAASSSTNRFFPSLAASFTVRRNADREVLHHGYVATADPGATTMFIGAELLRSPILATLGGGNAWKRAHFVQLDESQSVVGDDAALMSNARRIYDGTSNANRNMAKLLARTLSEPAPNR